MPKGANAILVTHDLTPSLTVQLDREAIAAIATDAGTRTSHVAILARSLGLPGVVGLRDADAAAHTAGETAILDGVDRDCSRSTRRDAGDRGVPRARAAGGSSPKPSCGARAALEPVTTDGVRITLRANVDLPEEAELARDAAAPRASA